MQGAGTQSNPYLISTPTDLDSIRNNLSAYYELVNDIDMSSFGNWNPIAIKTTPFKGSLDGKGHIIKNLTSNQTNKYFVGFFGYTANATLKNIGLENINISTNYSYCGGLVGGTEYTTIENCYTTGQISNAADIGGIVGNMYKGSVRNSFSKCTVTTSLYNSGGLIGTTNTTTIENCFSTGKVTSGTPKGGLVGNGNATITNSFWDTQTSGLTTSVGGTGKITSEMKTQSTFTGWDFTNTWIIQGDYPTLLVFGVPVVPKIETVTVDSYSSSIKTNLSKSVKSTKHTESFLRNLNAYINRKIRTEKNVWTYTLPINSNVEKSNKTVRSCTENVQAFISPITSSSHRESKTIKNLLSQIKPLLSNTAVLYPLNMNTPNAYVSTLENNSRAFEMGNMVTVSYIVNPSFVEVRE